MKAQWLERAEKLHKTELAHAAKNGPNGFRVASYDFNDQVYLVTALSGAAGSLAREVSFAMGGQFGTGQSLKQVIRGELAELQLHIALLAQAEGIDLNEAVEELIASKEAYWKKPHVENYNDQ